MFTFNILSIHLTEVTLHLYPMLTYVPYQRCTSLHKAVGVSELCQNYADAEMKKARSLKREDHRIEEGAVLAVN